MKTNDEIYEMLERVERTILAVTPFRRLPLDLQMRAAELQSEHALLSVNPSEREDVAFREFEKMLKLTVPKRRSAKWPAALVPRKEFERDGFPGVMWSDVKLDVVPLSGLVNRCVQRAVFNVGPGEITPQDNVMATLRKLELVITTLGELGTDRGQADVKVVHRKNFKMPESLLMRASDPVGLPISSDEEEEEPEPSPFDKMAAVNAARDKANGYVEEELGEEEEEEDEPVPPPVKKAAPVDEVTCDWSGLSATADDVEEEDVDIEDVHDSGKGSSPWQETLSATADDVEEEDVDIEDEEEAFEESDCARGVATIPSRDSLDDEDEEEDGDWGPDEVDFPNPIREQFEREAEEAAAREQAKLDSGEYFLLDGKVTKKKGR